MDNHIYSLHKAVAVAMIVFYGVFAMGVFMAQALKDTSKVGVGNFVMAVSYTESYDDLVYVSNFVNCPCY